MSLLYPAEVPTRKSRHLEIVPNLTQPASTAVEFSTPLMQRLGVRGWNRTAHQGNLVVKYAFLEAPDPVDDTPVAAFKGYFTTQGAYVPVAAFMAKHGRNTAILRSFRRQNKLGALAPAHIHDILLIQAQAAAVMLEDMQTVDGTTQADAFAHSQGTLTCSRLAGHKPGLFRTINAVAGAGTDGHHNPLVIASRIPTIFEREIVPYRRLLLENLGTDIAREYSEDLLRYPLTLMRQALTDTMSDARPGLAQARDHGVVVGTTVYERDSFFHPADIASASSASLTPGAFQELPGTFHVEPQLNPDAQAQAHLDFTARLLQLQAA